MGLFVKICGICSESDLVQISAFKPNALGFIQWEKSARHIDPALVGTWNTPASIQRVGVFVNPSEEYVINAVEKARLDVVQVHRVDASWDFPQAKGLGVEIWRALSPAELADSPASTAFDRYLLDSYDPKTVGGTGAVCDWEKAAEWVQTLDTPILLAGGLGPENVASAIQQVNPWGVDVSSGVEISPGVKDLQRVKDFIASCRASE